MRIARLLRPLYKAKVKRLVRRYLRFCEENQMAQSNMNLAEARLMKAKLIYWQSRFEPWGDLQMQGYERFHFGGGEVEAYQKELEEMGFTREIREKEWNLLKNDQYPSTLTYYPLRNFGPKGNPQLVSMDFKERKLHTIEDDDKYHSGGLAFIMADKWIPDVAYPDEKHLIQRKGGQFIFKK